MRSHIFFVFFPFLEEIHLSGKKFFAGDARVNRLREVMLLKRITQIQLSKMTGIPQCDISRIINDEKAIYLSTAKRIAKALGKTVDYLWPD